MRSRPGLVEPDVYFRIIHSAQVGHNNVAAATNREQTVEIAVESKGRLRLASLPLPQLRDLVRKLPPYLPGLPTLPHVVAKLVGLGLALELAVVLEAIVIQCP